jgi:hypothetical protein
MYCLLILGLGLEDLRRPGSLDPTVCQELITPRDLADVRHQIGHAGHRMTIQTYFHLPWILSLREQSTKWTKERLAAARGITLESARVELSRAENSLAVTDRELTRLGFKLPATQETRSQQIVDHIGRPDQTCRYCHALNDWGRGDKWPILQNRYAISGREMETMEANAKLHARQTGIAIGLPRPFGQRRLSRPPRVSDQAKPLYKAFDLLLASDRSGDLKELIDQWSSHFTVRRDNRATIRLPKGFQPAEQLLADLEIELKVRHTEITSTDYLAIKTGTDVTSVLTWILSIVRIVLMSEDQAMNS